MDREEKPILPFHGISIDRQLDILKAFCVYYDKYGKPASYKDIAPLVGLHPTKVSACLKFWKSVGLLDKKGGDYAPTEKAVEFARRREWKDDAGAWAVFRSAVGHSWFMEHAATFFRMKENATEENLVVSLGSVSGIAQGDKATIGSLKSVVRLLELCGMITKSNENSYRANREAIEGLETKVEIPDDKHLVQVIIGEEMFAVDAKELQAFVKEKGHRVDKRVQRIG